VARQGRFKRKAMTRSRQFVKPTQHNTTRLGDENACRIFRIKCRQARRDLIGIHKVRNRQIITQNQRRDGGFTCTIGTSDNDDVGLGHMGSKKIVGGNTSEYYRRAGAHINHINYVRFQTKHMCKGYPLLLEQ